MKYVQLNGDQSAVIGVFAGPQEITEDKPGYASVPNNDARLKAFLDGQAVADLCAGVDRFRDARLADGFADAVTGKTWQCDPSSITIWTGQAALAQPWALDLVEGDDPTFYLIPADNSTVTLTPAEVYALVVQRIMPWVQATYFFAREMKNDILNDDAPDDITVGWP